MLHEIFKGMDNAAEKINENFLNCGVVDHNLNEVNPQNGYFIKYENGRLECWHDSIIVNETTTQQYGAVFGSNGFDWTFPSEFVSPPIVIPNVRRIGGGGAWGGQSGTISNTQASDLRILGTHDTSRGTLQSYALGSWK